MPIRLTMLRTLLSGLAVAMLLLALAPPTGQRWPRLPPCRVRVTVSHAGNGRCRRVAAVSPTLICWA
ncbi:MAG: hypothetical protein R3E79_22845 [Caldilineaceae bacterium]